MPNENTVEVATDVADKAGRYLTFQLGEESYGISVLKVREIIQMQSITRIPRTQAYMKGVINLRGKVIPVADLRIKFEFEKAEVSERTCIIVVSLNLPDGRETLTGLIVDAVEEVMQIEAAQIEDAPSFTGTSISMDYIFGMAKVKENVKMLLDIDKVVSAERVEKIEEQASELELAEA
ncbi:MAG: chemotaxis protein CheW [Puniceicoccaceae bacterium]